MSEAKHMKHEFETRESDDSLVSFAVSKNDTARKRRSRFWLVISIIIVFAGIVLISYPFVSDWINQLTQDEVSATQENTVTALPKADLSAEKERAITYNKNLRNGSSRVIDPFDSKEIKPGTDEYKKVLNVAGDGVMGELIIPKISVDLPIYHFTTDDVLQRGVGHVVNTSVPIGGESTHTVLAGHTGLPTARLFDRLNELQTGDWFIIRVLGEDHAYKVTSTEVVLPEQVNSLSIESEKDQVTLVTCTPYGVNTHRLLVHAERTEVPAEWINQNKLSNRSVDPSVSVSRNPILFSIAGVLCAGIISLIIFLVMRHRKFSRIQK